MIEPLKLKGLNNKNKNITKVPEAMTDRWFNKTFTATNCRSAF